MHHKQFRTVEDDGCFAALLDLVVGILAVSILSLISFNYTLFSIHYLSNAATLFLFHIFTYLSPTRD